MSSDWWLNRVLPAWETIAGTNAATRAGGDSLDGYARAAQQYFDPADPVEREFYVIETVRYKVMAVSEEDAVGIISRDADRDRTHFDSIEERYAYEVDEDAL